jgi:hypothetical protein
VSAFARVGLLAACDDPQLLRFPLWPRQRELLRAVESGPRLHVWALGRRSAKTTSAAIVGLWCCLLRPELLECLRPGERGYAVAVATNLRQARLFVRSALSIVERSPLLAELVESASEDEIAFSNGTALTAFPCTSRGGRGWPIFALLMDEAAHFLDTDGNSAAEAIWQALVPSTAQFGDAARVIVSSTPYGQAGLFADLWHRAAAGELADAVAQHASTAEANPTIERALLEQEHARDPEGFRQEYEASFLAGGSSFLDPLRIREAVADRGELAPSLGSHWVAGLDPAFASDPFGLAIVGRDSQRAGRLVLGLAMRWRPASRKPVSLEDQRRVEDAVLAEVAEVCRRYGATAVTDQFRAAGVADRLRRLGVPVRVEPMTEASKSAAYSELRARLNAEELELYEEPTLLAELRRLRTRYLAGRAAVVNPRSGDSHGDVAQALALAVWGQRRWRSDLGGGAGAGSVGPLDEAAAARILDACEETGRETKGERVGRRGGRLRRIGPG